MSKPKIFNKWITSLVIVAVVGIAALGIYQFGIAPGLPEEEYAVVGGEDKPFEFETVDSSSCIACHTNEAIIAASTVGQEVEEVASAGG
ncbi:MAG: hypothetical protein RBR71_06425 [Gudongella sp.]|nr:hypothetical protein [Gudongella sp.]